MKPASFTYHAPTSVDEAIALLAKWGPQDGRILAGGQSLVPIMAFRMAQPAHLIDINGIAELSRMVFSASALVYAMRRSILMRCRAQRAHCCVRSSAISRIIRSEHAGPFVAA